MNLQELIDQANREPDPILCNLKITLAHRELARRLRAVTGEDAGANFHSWAVWGSKKAGVTIRQEDLDDALKNATQVSGSVGLIIGIAAAAATTVTANLAPLTTPAGLGLIALGGLLGAICGATVGRTIARYSRRTAARLVLEGNRLVLDDIGRQTAAFVQAFPPQVPIDAAALEALLDGMKPGPAEQGGQDLLRNAFRLYARAAELKDPSAKHQAVYHANLLAILNEHIKLQPYIAGSMPFIVRRCVTERMLTFDIGPLALAVSHDVPSLDDHHYPLTLVDLTDDDLRAFLTGPSGWDRTGGTPLGSRAGDWTRLADRMGYIVHLFRCFHLDPAVHAPPYEAHEVDAMTANAPPYSEVES